MFKTTQARTLTVRAFSLFVGTTPLLMLGCAQRIDELDEKIVDVQQRTSLLEAKTGGPVGNDRELLEGQKLADVRSQISAMRNELTVISGKVEALEYETKRISTRQDQMAQELEVKLKPTAKNGGSDNSSNTPESDYDAGIKAHQDGEFAKAEKLFDAYLAKNPKGSFADRSIYWIAEGFMAQKLYKKAIAKYQDLVDRFPKSEKRCDAMAKQIQGFKALGMQKEATVFTQVREAECK